MRQIHPNIAPGHIFVSIGGIALQGSPHEALVRLIRSTPRPCTIRMCYYA